jgi:hypothetical protein
MSLTSPVTELLATYIDDVYRRQEERIAYQIPTHAIAVEASAAI